MAPKSGAKTFMHDRSQAVRLPGTEVTLRKAGNGVLLEPIEQKFDVKAWREKLRASGAKDFLPEGRPD